MRRGQTGGRGKGEGVVWRYVCKEWRELEGLNAEGRKNMDRNNGGVVVEINSSTYVCMLGCYVTCCFILCIRCKSWPRMRC